MSHEASPLREFAPAKVNLWLHVLGRRADGFHELDSLVAFADVGDELTFTPADALSLRVDGPFAKAAGPIDANLVTRAVQALSASLPSLRLGLFALTKHLPAAAGLGGGSADAAAAMRLLAVANGLPIDQPAFLDAADSIGSDVRACLQPRARLIRGRGDIVGPALAMPALHAVLVNPGVACPTGGVFAALGLPPGDQFAPRQEDPTAQVAPTMADIAAARNDLQEPAARLAPDIAHVLEALHSTTGIELARMSGSGATCFGIYPSRELAEAAAAAISRAHRAWWVRAATLA
jgi:4-diphosphocytidyl-2-C-methyl-D-erythritol kinase